MKPWQPFQPTDAAPWSKRLAAHLYRRAGFAATSAQLRQAAANGYEATLDAVLNAVVPSQLEQEMKSLGDTILAGGEPKNLSAWWLYRMLHSPDQLAEKATLFWHGHFAASAVKVENAGAMLDQHRVLRQHARGDFAAMTQAISRDPAMLIYLDSTDNRKTHPNENYARELMELFCLGLGNYTEADIQQIARCFTGWEVRRGKFRFNKYQHDSGVKNFLGASGAYGGEDAVKIVLQEKAAPRFIATKLVRFFVMDEPTPSAELIEPLATQLREEDFHVDGVIRRILSSQLFFSDQAVARKVRSPVELGVGLLRALEGRTNLYELVESLETLGQTPFYPPSVKGWDGGRTWINSATLLGRTNLVQRLIVQGQANFEPGLAKLAAQNADGAKETVDWLCELLLAVQPPQEVRNELIKIAGKATNDADIAKTIHAISTLPEFHLA